MLILSIISLVVPANACRRKPKVEIRKKFVEDPLPSYSLGKEHHWEIEIGVWTSVRLRSARVYDRFGAELKIDNITTPDKTYTFTYIDYADKYPTKQAYVSISDGTKTITHKLNWRGVRFGEKPYEFRIRWTGKTHKVHFKWCIGNLEANEDITIIVGVSTDLNPGDKQEYTSPCEHCINSGAVLKAKYKYRCRWRCICARSEELCIKVQCEEPTPAKLIIKKFNDTNGDGVFDGGDVMIAEWKIDVTDPDSVKTSYSTLPITLDITNFGTYTITEDLLEGWEQTALYVDDEKEPTSLTVTVNIGSGDERSVLYGNRKIPEPSPVELVVRKFNDTNGNRAFDEGIDNMISGWEITVEYPDGRTETHYTPVSLEITLFGTYTITEELRDGWVLTAVEIDGVYKERPRPTVEVEINAGDEGHSVLYGNAREAYIDISLGIKPGEIFPPFPATSTISWEIDAGGTKPVNVTLTLKRPDGTVAYHFHDDTPPIALTGSYTHTFTAADKGFWLVMLLYEYEYAGVPSAMGASGSIYVDP